jgi:hypothetical protein
MFLHRFGGQCDVKPVGTRCPLSRCCLHSHPPPQLSLEHIKDAPDADAVACVPALVPKAPIASALSKRASNSRHMKVETRR